VPSLPIWEIFDDEEKWRVAPGGDEGYGYAIAL
jgi:hypothetical protein